MIQMSVARPPFCSATRSRRSGNARAAPTRLLEAVSAYRDALKEWTRERVPLDWAMTQNNLGTALWTLGQRESGTERLLEARQRLPRRAQGMDPRARAARLGHDAEQPRQRAPDARATRERHRRVCSKRSTPTATRSRNGPASASPLHWATTQNNLGNALWTLGERESGTERLLEAVNAYRDALKEWTRERVPLDWAMTQNNLGNALRTLGERESGTERLLEAVNAYRDALKEWTRERVPLHWATTQNNLGNALSDARGTRERHRAAARSASTPTATRSRNGPASACRSTGP